MKPEIEAKVKNQKEYGRRLSVLMFFNDGIAHAMSRRVLNQTYYYLRNEQGGISLDTYHTVGLNTFPNMIPYLTGNDFLIFNRTCKRVSNKAIFWYSQVRSVYDNNGFYP